MSQVPLDALSAVWPTSIIKFSPDITPEQARRWKAAFLGSAKDRQQIITSHGMKIEPFGPFGDSPIYDRLAYEYGWAA